MLATLAAQSTTEMILNASSITALLICIGLIGMGFLIGIPLRDIARALSERNATLAKKNTTNKDIPALRGEVAEVRETTGRHAARLDTIDDQIARLDTDVAGVADAVNQVADKTGVDRPEQTIVIAGSYWKRQAGMEAPAGAAWATEDATATYQRAATDHTTHSTRTFPVPPFVPEDPSQVWGHMLRCIERETGQRLWPWTINTSVPADANGTPFTLYDTYRGKFAREYDVDLPANMHDLWPNLVDSDEWQKYGPHTSI